MNCRSKNESIQSICWAYFPLQLRNLDNKTFSSRKNHPCIPAETLENLCTERKMAPNIVKNEDVYRKTAAIKWSNIIQKRRLKWFGKVIRADEPAPAKKAFNYANAPNQQPHGNAGQPHVNLVEHYQIRLS